MPIDYYIVSQSGGKVDWDFNPRILGRTCGIPQVLCSHCGRCWLGDRFSAIPEPFPPTLSRLLRSIHRRPRPHLEVLTITPAEFRQIEEAVRAAFGFPRERRVLPGVEIGPLYLKRKQYQPKWDVYAPPEVGRVIFTGRARRALDALQIPNLQWFAVLNSEKQPLDLWQIVVLGHEQLPEVDTGRWFQCSECLRWNIVDVSGSEVGFSVPEQAQGQDILFLAGVGLVVSDRVVDALWSLSSNPLQGLELNPLSRYRADFALISYEELERVWRELEEEYRGGYWGRPIDS